MAILSKLLNGQGGASLAFSYSRYRSPFPPFARNFWYNPIEFVAFQEISFWPEAHPNHRLYEYIHPSKQRKVQEVYLNLGPLKTKALLI